MIIDFHTHIFPDDLARRAVPKLAAHSNVSAFLDGTMASLRASMKKNGIDKSVFLQIATKPSQTPTVNAWAIEQNCDDLIGFGCVHPEYPQWKDELDRLADAGIKGIKLHPDYQGFYVDADNLKPIYEHAIAKGLIIVFHAGIDIAFPNDVHCTPDRLLKIYDILKHGKIVLAHMGGSEMWDEVETKLSGTSFYFDTAYCAGLISAEQFKRIILKHGIDKILFASDSPWEDQALTLKNIRDLRLPSSSESAILGENAWKLLN